PDSPCQARRLRGWMAAMCDADRILRQYDRLLAWVARERARFEAAGIRPDQAFLLRSRLCDDIERLELEELLCELNYFK
ncbi:MAG: hypothetical protein O6938_02145, partial [Gammaproteobacteria bacterium]|nr:hypothetical protein [Gammaproteobacteria bacterium]